MIGSTPEIPIAILICPSLNGLPKVSVITIPTSLLSLRLISSLIIFAVPFGSSGSNVTIFSSWSTLLVSTPALAQTKPCLVSDMITPFSRCINSFDSDSIISTILGSFF